MTRWTHTMSPNDGLGRRVNDLNNDIQTALGRFDEALDLLGVWTDDYPDSDLARMSRSLIRRCTKDTP